MKNMIALSLCVLTVVLTFAGCDLSTIVNNFTTPPAETDKPGTMTENTEKPMETQVQEPLIAEGTCGSDITWKLSVGGDLTLTGKRTMSDAASESQVPWHAHRKDIRTVQIEPGITGICDYAFFGCSALTQITIPESVKAIGDRAFEGCTGLTKITIPNVKCTIGDSETTLGVPGTTTICGVWSSPVHLYAMKYGYPFELCDVGEGSNTAIAYGAYGNILWKLSKNGALNLLGKGNMPSTASASEVPWLSHSKDICTVQIGSGITSICDYAFSGCSALTSIGPTGNIQSIGVGAFAGCVSLKNIIIPSKVTAIRNNTFSGCTGLVQITITDKVTTIGAEAFSGCTGLKNILILNPECTIATSADTLGVPGTTLICGQTGSAAQAYATKNGYQFELGGVFTDENNRSVTWHLSESGVLTLSGTGYMPDFVTVEAPWYPHRQNIRTVQIKPGFFHLGSFAFKDCTALTQIDIPDGIERLGQGVFQNCSSLTQITLPNKLTQLSAWAFEGCSSLTQIVIPDGVTRIEDRIFADCTRLSQITMPKRVASIGIRAFYNCSSLTQITIPDGAASIEWEAFYRCSKLTEINIPSTVKSIGDRAFYECTALTQVHISDGVTSIGEYAFYECTALTKVHIAGGVTSIGAYAFKMCENLVQVTLPDCLTTLGESAFCWCSNLKEINIPTSLTAIEKHTFMGCNSLTQITLPNGITMIGKGAFDDCYQLKQISIPESVTSIGERAFCGCDSLTKITIPTSVTAIGDRAFDWTCLAEITILNKDCAISETKDVFGYFGQATIRSYKDSTAQAYAEKYGYKFVAID